MSIETIVQLALAVLTLLVDLVRLWCNRTKPQQKSKKISAELSFKFKQK